MIRVIYGRKGSGKTKRIIDMANIAVRENDGDLVFIDDDNRYMFDLRHEIRFINAAEYSVSSPEIFLGFLSGIFASNYDMGLLFVDGFLRLVQADLADLAPMFERLEQLAEKHKVDVVLSISGDTDNAPEFMARYII